MADMPLFTVSKTFFFNASHQIPGLPEGHPESFPHGHSFSVTLVFATRALDTRTGRAVDLDAIEENFMPWLAEDVTGSFINEVAAENAPNPTAEAFACWVFRVIRGTWAWGRNLKAVEIHEDLTPFGYVGRYEEA